MKGLLLIFAFLLALVAWNHGQIDKLHRENTRLQRAVDSLEQVVFVRQWVDRGNFNRLITNVQLLNCNTVIKRPQLKKRIDQHEEYWQLWQELGEE